MKALTDYVHGLGLSGIYSSPGPWTCGGCAGSYGYESKMPNLCQMGLRLSEIRLVQLWGVLNGIPLITTQTK
jgi:alpha-galactosidase